MSRHSFSGLRISVAVLISAWLKSGRQVSVFCFEREYFWLYLVRILSQVVSLVYGVCTGCDAWRAGYFEGERLLTKY